jgi:hypothetical protein
VHPRAPHDLWTKTELADESIASKGIEELCSKV